MEAGDQTEGTLGCRMMDKSAVVEYTWENHHLMHWEETTVLDHGRGQKLSVKEALHIQMTTGSPWLLDCCDEKARREEQSSPTFDLKLRASSVIHGYSDIGLNDWSIQLKCWQVIFRAQVGTR